MCDVPYPQFFQPEKIPVRDDVCELQTDSKKSSPSAQEVPLFRQRSDADSHLSWHTLRSLMSMGC
ncbi:TPA: hypothetical protein DEP34_05130 [Candidatus Uhrbacteria bacterium]|uniref:Uncharacterized protein n=2 Tax=Candidatus Uhriibacteriota TaxID=1752732 RepID=A0A0G1Q5P6_9BACT|nr:MAG: hypothetical protein UX45_C0029G0012 [Candidatus Uhrbacteria bacterium GW2011_GWF2_46_218]KKU40304.1 MAG: hypothetical protein UX57_C0020G0012 [Candidatus Uhrbacteria bacterium GW2011_GWE2_46_68]OGT96905.1 MAG: hypothetical protein A2298_02975 [Gammaproteobacteria bacterium RIFOXYB2_FULL_38_6]HBK33429.1 hypothetical protein [Candidatus Uhrbacteria bacterium]HCB19722.1 hypothetical protein [Candidatus Uhrbacteria bacterium]